MNYAHLTTVFSEFGKEDIINKIRKENSFDVSLTEKGKKICECLLALKKAIETTKEEIAEEIKKEEEGNENESTTTTTTS